ncbi:MAG: beta-ketoacyl synthase N-terminal-like domain-containing protein, partial [Myxococcota bacterium]
LAAWQERADIPAIMRGLVTPRPGAAEASETASPSALRSQLAPLPQNERERAILDLTCGHVATALGAAKDAIDPGRPLQEVGLDSLIAVELRNRLTAATGLRLSQTLLYDYPTPNALAEFLLGQLFDQDTAVAPTIRVASASDEPIAIVSMGCRFPGGVRTPEALWQLLADGTDAVTPFPGDRGWDVDRFYNPDPDAVGTFYVREGGFLSDPATFDAGFFGLSPREAIHLDPQQRMFLETSWEAFERAGIDPATLSGSLTGAFVGVTYNDYRLVVPDARTAEDGYGGLGTSLAVASGRIAYTFGLQGPAVTVDTACSSSLVALHLAAQSLRNGECDLALAGGATVFATLEPFVIISRIRAMSPDGRCRAFSADADGAGWSEGVGMVLLERLSDAQRNGHPVLAVVRGSAINQDGKSQGLTAPNGLAQQRVIRQALASAELSPLEVDAVEAHGTGTSLGDPIEVEALMATYGRERSAETPLWLGSLKSNIGHTQAAAGIAGIMKMVMALQNEQLPKTLHADELSPVIDWSGGQVRVLNQEQPWTENGHPRRAGVSSFGISGTNAHVILEQAPPPTVSATADTTATDERDAALAQASSESADAEPAALPLLLSGKSEAAVRAQAARLREHLIAQPELSLSDIAHSLATTRSTFDHRAVIVAAADPAGPTDTEAMRQSALAALDALAGSSAADNLVIGHHVGAGKIAFVCPGQGSQWADMARQLLASSEVFRDSITACDRALSPYVSWSLLAVLSGTDDSSETPWMKRIDVIQPVLFSMMVSLAALWRSMGVEPDAVIGHSQGEIAAACIAGALSLDDAAKVVALRSLELTKLAGKGAMASVEQSADELATRLERWGERLSVAVINGPRSTVVSGDPEAIDELVAELEGQSIFARKVRVDIASHNAQMEVIRDALLEQIAAITPRDAAIPLYSTLSRCGLFAILAV